MTSQTIWSFAILVYQALNKETQQKYLVNGLFQVHIFHKYPYFACLICAVESPQIKWAKIWDIHVKLWDIYGEIWT